MSHRSEISKDGIKKENNLFFEQFIENDLFKTFCKGRSVNLLEKAILFFEQKGKDTRCCNRDGLQ